MGRNSWCLNAHTHTQSNDYSGHRRELWGESVARREVKRGTTAAGPIIPTHITPHEPTRTPNSHSVAWHHDSSTRLVVRSTCPWLPTTNNVWGHPAPTMAQRTNKLLRGNRNSTVVLIALTA
jgi:hypothetical protein